MKYLACFLMFLFSSVVHASETPCSNAYRSPNRTLISAAALNGTAATRTFTATEQELQGYGVFAVYVAYTYSAATSVTMTCTVSDNAGTTYFTPQVCSTSSGVCTSSDASWVKTGTASANWVWRVSTLGMPRLKCVFAGGGTPGAGDLITVRGYAVAQ